MEKKEIPKYEKNKGAEAFKNEKFEIAAKHYSKALISLNYLIKDGD